MNWHNNKTLPSHNPENASHLWQGAPGQNPISYFVATEAPSQGAQCMKWKGNLTPITSTKEYQCIQSPLTKKAVR